ncbi:MAG TPA: 6,7-dimethyl-8-ribityllumazine synthase [candidate division WOR-3 bacterium]|uniref:6,7-dimethyl-8-ribityllumazine synthase n=1 Tax=candidate division WOR-3 bacterium TaxID=2052148 RepID=A0A7C0ZBW5_UNCW3|nr:6,7-dimethyl-8-ribityllumazine synthase [candidate division WOR-3 bacterium]
MEYKGSLTGKGKRVAVVVSRFNSLVTEKLLEGALDCLIRHGVDEKRIDIVRVPGSFELPFVVKRVAEKGRYDGIVALSAVIRGDTPHFDYVATEVSKGIARLTLDLNIPIGFGVITADTEEQAIARAGMKQGNKGWDAAMSVLEVMNLLDDLGKGRNA